MVKEIAQLKLVTVHLKEDLCPTCDRDMNFRWKTQGGMLRNVEIDM